MTRRKMKRLGAACLGLAGILAGCQAAQPSGPAVESPESQVENVPQAGHAKADTAGKAATDVPATLNDPCFPGRGTALPASCGGGVTDPVTVPDGKAVTVDIPAKVPDPVTVAVEPPTVVTKDVPTTLNDPCFPGRGAPLPASCGVEVTVTVTVPDPKAVAVDTAKVTTDGGQTLDDPCFQGRGGPLPASCGT